jgi:molecular chaperone DnaK (HSP70)
LLKELKQIAENDTNVGNVAKAVISVPSNFSTTQGLKMKPAAEAAGLSVLEFLSEPTAAILAYDLERGLSVGQQKNIFVIDLGAAFLDAVIITIKRDNNEPTYTKLPSIDTKMLGGKDFTEKLIDYFLSPSKWNISPSEEDKASLRKAFHDAKKTLFSESNMMSVDIDMSDLPNMPSADPKLSVDDFNAACQDLFDAIAAYIEGVIQSSEINKDQIDGVILAGGSTRIQGVIDVVQNAFPGKRLYRSINPDYVIAYGAAKRAMQLADDQMPAARIIEPISFSLGYVDFFLFLHC